MESNVQKGWLSINVKGGSTFKDRTQPQEGDTTEKEKNEGGDEESKYFGGQ